MSRDRGTRPLWLTLPLYAVLFAVIVLDVRAAVFWAQVGGSLGPPVTLGAAGIATLAVALILLDLRRQVTSGWTSEDEDRE